jgi:hypothetical protein
LLAERRAKKTGTPISSSTIAQCKIENDPICPPAPLMPLKVVSYFNFNSRAKQEAAALLILQAIMSLAFC